MRKRLSIRSAVKEAQKLVFVYFNLHYICPIFALLTGIVNKSSTNLSDCNWTQTRNHLVHKRTLNQASLAKRLSVHLRTKWLWVRV